MSVRACPFLQTVSQLMWLYTISQIIGTLHIAIHVVLHYKG